MSHDQLSRRELPPADGGPDGPPADPAVARRDGIALRLLLLACALMWLVTAFNLVNCLWGR